MITDLLAVGADPCQGAAMPSRALGQWNGVARGRLDEIEAAHRAVSGAYRGRRLATSQINHAYTVLLSSHFQGYCRDLHSEAIDYLANRIRVPWADNLLRVRLAEGRKLDSGNPNPGNLGADFARFGMTFWPDVYAAGAANRGRRGKLDKLNAWRNAIAHQDFTDVASLDLGGGRVSLRLSDVRDWRAACRGLAVVFDRVLADHIAALVGARPW